VSVLTIILLSIWLFFFVIMLLQTAREIYSGDFTIMANSKMTIKRLTVPMGRLNYVHLDEPTAAPNTDQTPSYQVTLIYGADDDLKSVRDLIDELAIAEFGKAGYKQLISKGTFKNPLRSNSLKTYFDEEGEEHAMPGFEDADGFHISFKTRSKDRLTIYDAKRAEIDESAVIAGYYARVNGGFGAFDIGGGKGVTAYLNAIQICKVGEVLGGGSTTTSDDFSDFDGDGAVLSSDISEENSPF